MLEDAWTYEQWRDKLGAELVVGQAWCHLKINQDTAKARECLGRVTEAQFMEMPEDNYYAQLIVQVDDEI